VNEAQVKQHAKPWAQVHDEAVSTLRGLDAWLAKVDALLTETTLDTESSDARLGITSHPTQEATCSTPSAS
jgi:hypothetical protein